MPRKNNDLSDWGDPTLERRFTLDKGWILFWAGLISFAAQLVIWSVRGRVEPTLLIMSAAMMGLPGFLKADEKK